jgi:hypothetical protein
MTAGIVLAAWLGFIFSVARALAYWQASKLANASTGRERLLAAVCAVIALAFLAAMLIAWEHQGP